MKHQKNEQNVPSVERWISSALGGLMIIRSLRKLRSPMGWFAGVAGISLLKRGLTGHCDVYQLLDVNRTEEGLKQKKGFMDPHPVEIRHVLTIWRPAEEVFRFFRDVTKTSAYIPMVQHVHQLDDRHYEIEFKGPRGRGISTRICIDQEDSQNLIGWSGSLPGLSQFKGQLQFKPAPKGNGTEVNALLTISPRWGASGAAIARLLKPLQSGWLANSLYDVKQAIETGEVATNEEKRSDGTSLAKDKISPVALA